jgi:hypothetical protein
MKSNNVSLAVVRGIPFSQILEYKEDGKNVFTDFVGYVFKGQVRSARSSGSTLQCTFGITVVGLGQVKIHLTDVQTGLMVADRLVYDILAAKTAEAEQELAWTGEVAVGGTATVWENAPPVTTITPAVGAYNVNQSIALHANEVGARIYFTTDGTAPTAVPEHLYTAPIPITATTTFKFFAVDTAGNIEVAQTAVITIDKVAPVTTPDPVAGTYAGTQNVALNVSKSNCLTYYTTNGSTPTTASAQYATPIAVAADATLKFFSVDAAGNIETVKSAAYVITV